MNESDLDLIPLSSIEPRVIDWLWMNRIARGMINVVAGMPSGGKSLFTIYLGAKITHPPYGPDGKGANVIVSSREDLWHEMLRPRFEAAGADLDRVGLATNLLLPSDIENGGLDRIAKKMIKKGPADLLIIDPVSAHLDDGINRYNDSMRRATNPLFGWAQETHTAVLMVEHSLKHIPRSAHPLNAIGGGNSGLRAAARIAFILGKDPDDDERIVMCCVKPGPEGEPKPLAFTLDAEPYMDAKGRTGTAGLLIYREELPEFDVMSILVKPSKEKKGRPPAKRAEAAEWLTDYLFKSPDFKAEVHAITDDARSIGISFKTLDRAAREDLEIKRDREGREKVWWTLPQKLIDECFKQGEEDDDDE